MAKKNCLGIHYDKELITAVLAEKNGAQAHIVADWTIRPVDVEQPSSPPDSPPEEEAENFLVTQLAQQVKTQSAKSPPAVLALAGRFYQSQMHHSTFSDPQQISKTLRFDIEDEFSANGEVLAICYQPITFSEDGCDLIVHTTGRFELQQLCQHFFRARLDPVVAVPDINGWIHFLRHVLTEFERRNTLFLARAADQLYLLVIDDQDRTVLERSCLCSEAHTPEMLTTELQRCMVVLADRQKPRQICYHPDHLDKKWIEVIKQQMQLPCLPMEECCVNRVFAAGAAFGWLDSERQCDFRADGLPPQSLTYARRRALYGLSVALSLLFLILTLIMNIQARRYQNIDSRAREDMVAAWQQTHPGQKPPRSRMKIPKEMRVLAQTIKAKSQDQTAQAMTDSASRTLLLVLKLLNQLPEDFDLWIDSLRVADDSANLSGSVPDLKQLNVLIDLITRDDCRLQIDNWDFALLSSSAKQGLLTTRRSFNLPLSVRKDSRKGGAIRDGR